MCLFVLSDIFLFVLLILSLLLPVITSSDGLGSVLFLFCFSIGLFLVCLNAVFFCHWNGYRKTLFPTSTDYP